MDEKIKNLIEHALKKLGVEAGDFGLEHPADLKMGDYSTNVAMACAKDLKISPKELAAQIILEINKNLPAKIEKIEVAGPGFINFYLSREFFTESIENILNK